MVVYVLSHHMILSRNRGSFILREGKSSTFKIRLFYGKDWHISMLVVIKWQNGNYILNSPAFTEPYLNPF